MVFWIVIGGFRSVLFVSCFKIRCFEIVLFQTIIDELSFLRRFFWSFLFLSLAKIKQPLPASFDKKNPLTIAISFAILEQSRVILNQAGRARYIVICINPAFIKMIDETEKPTFAIRVARYNEFRCKPRARRKRLEKESSIVFLFEISSAFARRFPYFTKDKRKPQQKTSPATHTGYLSLWFRRQESEVTDDVEPQEYYKEMVLQGRMPYCLSVS